MVADMNTEPQLVRMVAFFVIDLLGRLGEPAP